MSSVLFFILFVVASMIFNAIRNNQNKGKTSTRPTTGHPSARGDATGRPVARPPFNPSTHLPSDSPTHLPTPRTSSQHTTMGGGETGWTEAEWDNRSASLDPVMSSVLTSPIERNQTNMLAEEESESVARRQKRLVKDNPPASQPVDAEELHAARAAEGMKWAEIYGPPRAKRPYGIK